MTHLKITDLVVWTSSMAEWLCRKTSRPSPDTEIPCFYATRKSVSIFTRTHCWALFGVGRIQFTFWTVSLHFRIYPRLSLVLSRYLNCVNRSLLEKQQESQTGKEISVLSGNRIFITVFARTRHWAISWTIFIHCTQPHIMAQ